MKTRSSIIVAVLLIVTGSWFLAIELYSPLKEIVYGADSWPLSILGVGILMAIVGLVTWAPSLMIPASIISGIGGLLYWQNTTGNWESWAYAWALIPGFVGVGLLLTGLMTRNRNMLTGAGWTLFNSLVLFVIFGYFLGGGSLVTQFWPVLLIALGLILLGRGLVRRR